MKDNQIKQAALEAEIALKKICVLCVDDEIINLDILEKHLVKSDYDTIRAVDGEQALDILDKDNHGVDIVLLDRMMPKVDGMEVLKVIKRTPHLAHIPVIMQTAMAGADEAVEGIEAGAYYYITKPYEAQVLLSVVDSASREYRERCLLQSKLDNADAVLKHATQGAYEVRTMKEAREVAAFLAGFSDSPSKALVALTALITNGIEHGILSIGYELKNEFLRAGTYEEEFLKRAESAENVSKSVKVEFKKENGIVYVYIDDEGEGFLWHNYMEFDPVRMTEPNGRGIALANSTNPGSVEYLGNGNRVRFTIQ